MLLVVVMAVTGCSNLPSDSERHVFYEVFIKNDSGKLVKLTPTDSAYHCKKGDTIVIGLHHKGADSKFLDWDITVTNLQDITHEKSYSTLRNIPLAKKHIFVADKIGTFSFSFTTWLTMRNVPVKTNKDWEALHIQGKMILVVAT